jgi:RNA:NAD 2'-phosphotransferase (TPT1/KptA family)
MKQIQTFRVGHVNSKMCLMIIIKFDEAHYLDHENHIHAAYHNCLQYWSSCAFQKRQAVHVTSQEGWEAIQTSGELRAMTRTHIHFATQPEQMRGSKWVAVALRLDLQAALAEGHVFGLSSNGVLLSKGPLPVRFVAELSSADIVGLPEEWRQRLVAQILPN